MNVPPAAPEVPDEPVIPDEPEVPDEPDVPDVPLTIIVTAHTSFTVSVVSPPFVYNAPVNK